MDKLKVEIESSDDRPLHEAKSRQRDFVKFGSIIAVIQG
jgi:pyruvate/2-oxoglutarate dehydrogenase complex dihydrolipoamide acyltransferase (E2) component